MSYNLHSKERQHIVVTDPDDNTEVKNDSEEGQILDQTNSDSNSEQGSDSKANSEDEDEDDVRLAERLSTKPRRGRPKSKLLGKNGFVWTTSAPNRQSGMCTYSW